MLKSALIPLDGSESSKQSVEQALRFHRYDNFDLFGLGVIDQPGITRPSMSALGADAYRDDRDKALLQDAEQRVNGFLEQFKTQCQDAEISHQTHIAYGDPCQAIFDEAEHHDLIFLGRKTNFYFETENQEGKTFRRLAEDSPRPIIAVSDTMPEAKETVLVGYDGSNQAARALQIFAALFLRRLPDVAIVTVHKNREEAEIINRRGCEFLEKHGAKITPYVVESSARPWEVISAQVEVIQPLLLVLGAYGKSGIREYFFGSTTKALLEHCPRPLFLYH